jgi:hypothetical protein
MIKLMNVQQTFISNTYSHTGSQGGTGYTITHNLGLEPDYVTCQVLDTSGRWVNLLPYYYYSVGSKNIGWQQYENNNTNINVAKFYVYQFDTGSGTQTESIRFICARLGPAQTVTNITPAFQWSSSEQVYPFEKADNGAALYCKQIDFGALPNNGSKNVAHNVPSLDKTKVYRIYGRWYSTSVNQAYVLPYVDTNSSYNVNCMVYGDNVTCSCANNLSASYAYVRIIYAK